MFSSFSDSSLSTFRWWVSWFAAGGSCVAVVCAVLTIFSTREATKRSATKLSAAEQQAKDANALAQKLELAARPRSLTPEQIANFVAALAGAPRGTIQVQYSDAADDGHLLARQIHDAINAAGGYSLPEDIQSATVLSTGKPGEGIGIKTNRVDNAVALAIQKAFAAIGIDAPGQLKDQQTIDAIVIVYRKKP